MILIVQKGCLFCEEFKELPGITRTEISSDGKTLKFLEGPLEGQTISASGSVQQIPGFPALLDGTNIYIGRDLIRKKVLATGIPCSV